MNEDLKDACHKVTSFLLHKVDEIPNLTGKNKIDVFSCCCISMLISALEIFYKDKQTAIKEAQNIFNELNKNR